MTTRTFVAVIKKEALVTSLPNRARLLFSSKPAVAKLSILPSADWLQPGEFLVLIEVNNPLNIFWRAKFQVQDKAGKTIIAQGWVVDPSPEMVKGNYQPSPLLPLLVTNRQGMLLALLRRKGIRGLREKEIVDFSGLRPGIILQLAQKLEWKGLVRIINFSPLLLISQDSLSFLSSQVIGLLNRFHRQHPEVIGLEAEKIRKRFRLPLSILKLILARLAKEKQIIISEDNLVSLSSFEIPLAPEEKKLLEALEELCFRGEFHRVSMEEIRERFHLSHQTLNRLLSLLVAKKKILQAKDGYYLHSHWLEEIVQKLRHLGKKEFTVGEFKALTGLTRKYAIPLLELLDQMKITRRKGSWREIL